MLAVTHLFRRLVFAMIRTALMLVTWLASLTAVSAFDCNRIVDYNDAQNFADFKIAAANLGDYQRSYLPQTNYEVFRNSQTYPFIPPTDSVIFLKNENRVYMQVGTLNKNGDEYNTFCDHRIRSVPDGQWFDPDNEFFNRELLFDPHNFVSPDRLTCAWIYVGNCAGSQKSPNNEADIRSFVQQAITNGKAAVVAQAYQDANACN